MSKSINMTQGDPFRLLFRFALPLMLGNVFQQLYTMVDTAIVGKGVGLQALAALGSVDWLNWMMLGMAQGFTQGFSVRIAQKFGEGNREKLQLFMGQSALISGVLAVLCTGIGWGCLPIFLQFLRVPEELRSMAALYTGILMTGLPAVFFFNYCSAVLRAVGDSKTPLAAMTAAAILNIVLDLVAVFVLHWGIAGAAIATIIAQCVSGVICVIKICDTPQLRFSKASLAPRWDILKNLLKIGLPVAGKNLMVAIGGMVVMTVVNTFGTTFIAGFTATNKLYGLLEIAALSYSYAITTYVGQNYGAMRLDRISAGMKSATVLSLVTSVIIMVCMIVFGRPITMLFISAEDAALAMEAGEIAYQYLCVMAAGLPVLYILYLLLAAMQGLGDTIRPMISGSIEFLFRMGVAIVIARIGVEKGIFLAEPAAWISAMVYLLYCYRKRMKRGWREKTEFSIGEAED